MPLMDNLCRSYDEVPYPDLPKSYTHVARMAAIAYVHGLSPPSPAKCRVLELGCADGGNLLPMAWRFPQSWFVGIDFSSVQIEIGRKRISDLSLANLKLQRANIIDLRTGDLGRFDYIIVHGVYSWVSAEVQKKILAICRDHLSETGIAYISYNTYPGWCGKQAIREILRYHTRQIEDTQQKVEAAMALVATLPDSKELPGDPGALLVERLQKDLKKMDDPKPYLVHEYLIDGNEPQYFGEFLRRAEGFALRYVDDAFPGSATLERLPPKAQEWVGKTFRDYAEQQQYIDFFCNISFRRSLLCRGDMQPDNDVGFQRLRPLYATATYKRAKPEKDQSYFITHAGRRIYTEHAGLRRILNHLVDAHPASLCVSQLRMLLGSQVTDTEAGAMFDNLLRSAALEFVTHPQDCTRDIEERPYASRLVRFQCEDGLVTNAAHRPVRLENLFEKHLLGLLDGTRTLAELIVLMRKRLRPDQPADDDQWEALVHEHLTRLAQLGLLKDREKR